MFLIDTGVTYPSYKRQKTRKVSKQTARNPTETTGNSYIYVLLGEVLGVLSHHVRQVSFPDVKLLHLLLDVLHGVLLWPRGRQVLSAEGRAHTYLPAQDLRRRTTAVILTGVWLAKLC